MAYEASEISEFEIRNVYESTRCCTRLLYRRLIRREHVTRNDAPSR